MKIFNNVGFWEFLSVAVAIIVFLIAARLIILRFFKKSSNQITNQIHVTPSGIFFLVLYFWCVAGNNGMGRTPSGWMASQPAIFADRGSLFRHNHAGHIHVIGKNARSHWDYAFHLEK